MMLKFLADENIAPRVIAELIGYGYETRSIIDIKPGLSDDEIIKLAGRENRIILTHDKDFGNILKYPLKKHKGVILIRLKNQSPQNVIKYLVPLIKSQKEKLKDSLVILSEQGIRFYKSFSG
ncbi:DUF5615 family PIN-like protein [Patescibacteria group bacterium]|nr:DUF5615 family PIN-like protein [Patescibacteria group bacterium]MBU4512855.1 DUF5615 family PIN-like protein [Patescibacteria group bacterium]MCG2693630.1 DUF5615 family PIN-like protein [Candidatus Parcubacteria bacterium]